jgi:hypothetical protein
MLFSSRFIIRTPPIERRLIASHITYASRMPVTDMFRPQPILRPV